MKKRADVVPICEGRGLSPPYDQYTTPHNATVEATVLGACIIEPACIATAIEQGADMDSFHIEAHRQIWAAVHALFTGGRDVDTHAVLERIGFNLGAETFDWNYWYDYVNKIQDEVPSARPLALRSTLEALRTMKVRRTLLDHAKRTAHEALFPDGDMDDVVTSYQARALEVDAGIRCEEKSAADLVMDEVRYVDAYDERTATELLTGYTDIDDVAVMEPPALVVIAGRPGSGKTAFALNIMLNSFFDYGNASMMFGIDNSQQQLRKRMIAIRGGPTVHKLLRPRLIDDADVEALRHASSEIYKSKDGLVLNWSTDLTLANLWSGVNMAKARNPDLLFFVVDYLQLMRAPQHVVKRESRERQVAVLASGMKKIAKRLGVVAVALSQLRKAAPGQEGKRPGLSELRDTGQIEQDADVIIMLHKVDDNVIEASVEKNKDGPTRVVQLHFDGPHMRFGNLEQAWGGAVPPERNNENGDALF